MPLLNEGKDQSPVIQLGLENDTMHQGAESVKACWGGDGGNCIPHSVRNIASEV